MQPVTDTYLDSAFHLALLRYVYNLVKSLYLLLRVYVCVCVQSLNHILLFATPWTAGRRASLSCPSSLSLLKLTSIETMMPSNHLILCHPRLSLPSNFPSIRVFSNESVLCIQWPKYQRFSISPFNEYSGLISFRSD